MGVWTMVVWWGRSTPDTLLKQNSFIIWRGGTATVFDLKIEFCNLRLKRLPAHGGPGAIKI